MEETLQDIAELKQLASSCKRPNVRQYLASKIETLSQGLSFPANDPKNKHKTVSAKAITKLTNYAWDQSDKLVKLFLTLPIKHEIEAEKVNVTFQPTRVNLMLNNVDGKNFSFCIMDLLHPILPEKSHYKLKLGEIVIYLQKETSGKQWDCLTLIEEMEKKRRQPKLDKNEDPSASLMNMMKEMYATGDDDMKRTIAKAWCEAQDKQKVGPMGTF